MRISNNNKRITSAGFTLIEMMVAVALFSVVMLISVLALLSLIDANRRAQGLQSVMNNLNVALDGMVRSLRMGQDYEVDPNNKTAIRFKPYNENPEQNILHKWGYRFVEGPDANGSQEKRGWIEKLYIPPGSNSNQPRWIQVTAKEVDIDYVRFDAIGTSQSDTIQPSVLILIRGKAGYKKKRTTTEFSIQARATQRLLDL